MDKWKSEIQEYTVRENRGKPRIWLEGKRLEFAGFECGGRFEIGIEFVGGVEALVLVALPHGVGLLSDRARKVSGKNHRPIIDLSGGSCKPFNTGDKVKVLYSNDGVIVIKGAKE